MPLHKQALLPTALFLLATLTACNNNSNEQTTNTKAAEPMATTPTVTANPYHAYAEKRLDIYAPVTLDADLSHLSANQKEMLGLLIEAAKIMDELYWQQAYGDYQSAVSKIEHDATRKLFMINYGPWDRLNGDKPFVEGVGEKPLGANLYPGDMTKEEFQQADLADKTSHYTLLRRNEKGELITVPYHVAFDDKLKEASALLHQAAELAENPGFKKYLNLRAEALLTDEFYASDIAWLQMQDNPIGLVIGPIEVYEDQLFGYKAAYEAYVLLKDKEWSQRLARFAQYLPELQDGLPVPAEYKAEEPGSNADLNAYEVLYYGGHSNAGAKTIAINLPNSEKVQLEMGTRRLQLKNAMRAKFEKILLPIADELIAKDQRSEITFDAFFKNVMFHEVAHGLGIKNTITGKGTVHEALKETFSPLEEAKADILGLYMIGKLFEKGELTQGDLKDHYVTFLAGLFRSVRFGAASAHGKANMIEFNFFREHNAFTRNPETGKYSVNFENMKKAVAALANKLIIIQGDGDYETAKQLLAEKGVIKEPLASDLERLAEADIPVDIIFRQGKDVLGLMVKEKK